MIVPEKGIARPSDLDVADQKAAYQKGGNTYKDPAEAILLLGRMVSDIEILREIVPRLPFSSNYRSDLRLILAASKRLAGRAQSLVEREAG